MGTAGWGLAGNGAAHLSTTLDYIGRLLYLGHGYCWMGLMGNGATHLSTTVTGGYNGVVVRPWVLQDGGLQEMVLHIYHQKRGTGEK